MSALSVLCAQLTGDLIAITKFLCRPIIALYYNCLCPVQFLTSSTSNSSVFLKYELRVIQGPWKLAHFDRPHQSSYSYSYSTVTMAILYPFRSKRNIGRRSRFYSYPLLYITAPWENGCEHFCAVVFTRW